MTEFQRGYLHATRNLLGLQHQHWPTESLSSIRKLFCQVKAMNSLRRAEQAENSIMALGKKGNPHGKA